MQLHTLLAMTNKLIDTKEQQIAECQDPHERQDMINELFIIHNMASWIGLSRDLSLRHYKDEDSTVRKLRKGV